MTSEAKPEATAPPSQVPANYLVTTGAAPLLATIAEERLKSDRLGELPDAPVTPFPPSLPKLSDTLWFLEQLNGKDALLAGIAEWLGLDVAPLANGWIEWKGGESPFSYNEHVDVRLRDGSVFSCTLARRLRWSHHNTGGDVVAYKVVP